MSERPTIAAVVLTFNEALNIARCLEHLSWADEVVVVDSGSDDATVSIAHDHGSRVVTHVPDNRLLLHTEQRNWVLDNGDLKSDWVLFVDADEIITPRLRDRIMDVVTTEQDASTAAWQLCGAPFAFGRLVTRASAYPVWHDRLARRHVRYKSAGGQYVFDLNGGVSRIEIPYLHSVLSKGVSDWISRHDYYSSREAASITEPEKYGRSARSPRHALTRALQGHMWLRAPITFLYLYVLKRGFLDGRAGFVWCCMRAVYDLFVFMKIEECAAARLGSSAISVEQADAWLRRKGT